MTPDLPTIIAQIEAALPGAIAKAPWRSADYERARDPSEAEVEAAELAGDVECARLDIVCPQTSVYRAALRAAAEVRAKEAGK